MSYQPHYIASFEQESGLNTYYEPFLISEKAFPVLEDAYCFRGRVIKRPGYRLMGRLRRVLTTVAMGDIVEAFGGPYPHNETFPVFTGMGINVTEPFAQLQPGSVAEPLVITIAAPIGQTLTDTTGDGIMVPSAGVITAATINYNSGLLTLTFSAAAALSAATITGAYFPGLPVMGLRTQETDDINDEKSIQFDTKYAYSYNAGTKQFSELPSTLPVTWHGLNSDFFWSTNYYINASNVKLFWVTNDNMAAATRDPIYNYDSTTWAVFQPNILVAGASDLYNARVILPYKDRLLFLNTWEGTTAATIAGAQNFPQRLRYSQNGTPLAADAFRQDIVGKGGFIDAPTSEAITGAEFIKDTLIVKFERSSWKVVYTGNEILPFVFQKINTELGSESTFSLVPFDRGVFSIANYGVTTDDSINVERIDLEIPNTVFEFNNDQDGVKRVHGIRDYTSELVYWCFPKSSTNSLYPNQVLLYNYRNNTYAILNDSYTCFGYFQFPVDITWAQLPYLSWSAWNNAWASGSLQSLFPDVIAGTQHGFVEVVGSQGTNDPSLFVRSINSGTGAFLVPRHNLKNGDIVKLTGFIGTTSSMNGLNYIVSVVDDNNISLSGPNIPNILGTYIGNGMISKITNFTIATKRFAPFYESGSQCRVGYIDFLLDRTSAGEISSTVFVDEDSTTSMTNSISNPSLLGSDTVNTKPDNLTLIPFQASQKKIWHRQFVQAIAQNFQVVLTMSQSQALDDAINSSDFNMHALAFYISPNARLVQ